MDTIPILNYHNVGNAPGHAGVPGLYVTPRQFSLHMKTLSWLGMRGVSMTEGLPYLRGEKTGKIAILTFDDGYRDNVTEALPILAAHEFTATCFLVSGCLGSFNEWDAEVLKVAKPLMSAEEVRTWIDAGMDIGSHTCAHPHLPDLSRGDKESEISRSKRELEDLFDLNIQHFCYPYGEYDQESIDIVKACGYVSAVTTDKGRVHPLDDLFRLRRINVKGHRSFARFLFKLTMPYYDRAPRQTT